MKHPKILIFSDQIPQTKTAGCIILYNLFRTYPTDKLLVIGPPSYKDAQILDTKYIEITPPLRFLENTRIHKAKHSLDAFLPTEVFVHKKAQKHIKKFKPDIIITVMESPDFYQAARTAAEKNNIPLINFIHDINTNFEKTYTWASKRRKRKDKKFLKSASKNISISPQMQDYFSKNFSIKTEYLYPIRNDNITDRIKKKKLANRRFTIAYIGGLAYGYGEAIKKISPHLKDLESNLIIYSAPPGKNLKEKIDPQRVLFKNYITNPKTLWDSVRAEADALILPYDIPSGAHQELYSTHFPSKLTEYTQQKLPVIISGPKEATGVQWGLSHPNSSIILNSYKKGEWIEKIKPIINNLELQTELAENIYKYGQEDFSSKILIRKFHTLMSEVLKNPPTKV